MDTVLRGLDFMFDYVNDMLVSSSSEEEHVQHLRTLFQRLSDHGLVVKPAKCMFRQTWVDVLSHSISALGIHPHITRIEAVRTFQVPLTRRTFCMIVVCIALTSKYLITSAEAQRQQLPFCSLFAIFLLPFCSLLLPRMCIYSTSHDKSKGISPNCQRSI